MEDTGRREVSVAIKGQMQGIHVVLELSSVLIMVIVNSPR